MNITKLIFWVLFPFLSVLSSPSINYISPNQSVLLGTFVELNCSITAPEEEFKVIWAKLDQNKSGNPIFLSVMQKIVVMDPRISIKIDNKSFILRINSVEIEDSGFYACQIIIPTLKIVISSKTQLKIQ